MTTGIAWNLSNPLKPVALFDADAIRVVPVSWVDWLADIGATYSSHTIICESGLECVSSSHLNGVISMKIQRASGATLVKGKRYGFTCRIVTADGQSDDQTLYFKIK